MWEEGKKGLDGGRRGKNGAKATHCVLNAQNGVFTKVREHWLLLKHSEKIGNRPFIFNVPAAHF